MKDKAMKEKAITVYDIAKKAGVSPATVSRVLTGNARVSDEKKKCILDIIKEYDFEPNGIARSLSKKETNTIGMIVPDIRNPFYSNFFVECELAAAKFGYNMILCNTINNLSAEIVHLKNLMEKRVDAIIQVGGSVDEVHPNQEYIDLVGKISDKIPFIIAGELEGVSANVYRITPEPSHGMKDLLEYLLKCGHKDIALVGGWDYVIPTIRKRDALIEGLTLRNMPIHKEYFVDGDYTIEGGYKAMKTLLQSEKLPSVVIAINDIAATGMIKAIHESGLWIPEDISLVGYDNTFFSEITQPRLTSISYNQERYATKIIDTIKNVIGNQKVEEICYIPTILHVRDSCKDIRPN